MSVWLSVSVYMHRQTRVCHSTCVEARGQFLKVSSPFPLWVLVDQTQVYKFLKQEPSPAIKMPKIKSNKYLTDTQDIWVTIFAGLKT